MELRAFLRESRVLLYLLGVFSVNHENIRNL